MKLRLINHKNTNVGFTLVELLIVIVVIGILAGGSVVAYNGIQDRAYAIKAGAAVDSYVKLLEMYKIENGVYPDGSWACLGSQSDYPETTDFAAGVCSDYGDTTSSSLNNDLGSYTGSIPDGSLPAIDGGDGLTRGLIYSGWGDSAEVRYFVKGDQNCPKGEKSSGREGHTVCSVQIGDGSGGGGSGGGGGQPA